jgi:hypothetical protein
MILAWLSPPSATEPPGPGHAGLASPWPFIITFGAGFGIGVLGHLYGSRFMVGVGIASCSSRR